VVVAANNYFTFSDWRGAVDSAKCCIAKKQASQVSREINLMGRCADTENEISFLQSTLILLQNYTYEGDFNQITDAECLELIQRVNTICNCGDNDLYLVEDVCSLTEICVGGFYNEDGGDLIPLTPQTVYTTLDCTAMFSITALTTTEFLLVGSGDVWNLITDEEIVATNDTLVGTYNFTIGFITYSIQVVAGSCR
jgi:hypothetical protein